MKIGQAGAHPGARANGRFREILHPTAFTEGCEYAFAHALRLALAFRARLRILHVDAPDQAAAPGLFPSAVDALIRWGVLPEGATDGDLATLGIEVATVVRVGDSPTREILAELQARPVDLVVLSTRGLEGLERLRARSVAEPIVRRGHVPTLLFPPGVRGFVRLDDGRVDLTRVLVPVAHDPDPCPAIEVAVMVADALEQDILQLSTLHVGEEDDAPEVPLPSHAGWTVRRWNEKGPVAEGILDTALAWDADLVVMVSRPLPGRKRGGRGVVEHVLARALCPVLEVPARVEAATEGAAVGAQRTPEPVGS